MEPEYNALLADVDAVEHDPEVAHGREDDLLWDFVGDVAKGREDPETLARVANRLVEWNTNRPDRTRWCA